jgi:hypothetical protein
LNETIDQLKISYRKQQSLVICITKQKQKTFEVSMIEKFHTQKISLIGGIFIRSPYEQKERVKTDGK